MLVITVCWDQNFCSSYGSFFCCVLSFHCIPLKLYHNIVSLFLKLFSIDAKFHPCKHSVD